MDPLTLLIIGGLAGLLGGGIRASQERKQQEAQLKFKDAQDRARAQADERRRAELRAEMERISAESDARKAEIEAGRDYAGLDASQGLEYTRNLQQLQAQAAASGLSGGVVDSQVAGVLGNAIAASALARLQDDLNRQGLASGIEGNVNAALSGLLSDPSFSGLTESEAVAGNEALRGGFTDPFLGALTGLLGGISGGLPGLVPAGGQTQGQTQGQAQTQGPSRSATPFSVGFQPAPLPSVAPLSAGSFTGSTAGSGVPAVSDSSSTSDSLAALLPYLLTGGRSNVRYTEGN